MEGEFSGLQVYLRIRPPLVDGPGEPRLCVEWEGPGHVRLLRPGLGGDGRRKEVETFSGFTGIFPSTSGQEDVFEGVMAPLVRDLNQGKSSLLVAMGPTGAGKSHTVIGCDSQPGLLPRALQLLFNPKEQEDGGPRCELTDEARSVRISMFEIYSEHATRGEKRRDLLEDTELTFLQSKMKEEVTSTSEEAIAIAMRGMQRRSTAATGANEQSSRSHCIVTIKVASNVSLIIADLAGCEREKQTGNQGVRLTESTFINNTSMVFGQCLRALLEHQKNPGRTLEKFYQNSLLTKYLKSYMEAKGRMALIVNVSPKEEDYFNTAFVLKQAAPFSEIRTSLLPPTSQKKRPNSTSSRTWKRRCLPPPGQLSSKLAFEDPPALQTPDPISKDTEDYYWKVVSKVCPKVCENIGVQTTLFSLQEMEEALGRQKAAHQQEISLAVAEALSELERQHEAQVVEVHRQHEQQLSELKRQHTDNIRELQRQNEDTRCERERQNEDIVNQLQRLHAVAAEVLKSQLQQALQAQDVSSRLQGICTCQNRSSSVQGTGLTNSVAAQSTELKTCLTGAQEAEAIELARAEGNDGILSEATPIVFDKAKEEVGSVDDEVGIKEEMQVVHEESRTEDEIEGAEANVGVSLGGTVNVSDTAKEELEFDHAVEIKEEEKQVVHETVGKRTEDREVGVFLGKTTKVCDEAKEELVSPDDAVGTKQEEKQVVHETAGQTRTEEGMVTELGVEESEMKAKKEVVDKETTREMKVDVCSTSEVNGEEQHKERGAAVVDADESTVGSGITYEEESANCSSASRLSAAAPLSRPSKESIQNGNAAARHTPRSGRVGQQPKIVVASPKETVKKAGATQSTDCIGPLGYCLEDLLGLSVREIENGLWHNVVSDAAKISEVLAKYGGVLDVSDFSQYKLSLQKSLCIKYLFALISKKGFANKRLVELSDCFQQRASLFADIVRARTVGEAHSLAKNGLRQDGLMKTSGKADGADGEEDYCRTPAARLRGPGSAIGNPPSRTVTRTTSKASKTEAPLSTARKAEGPSSATRKTEGSLSATRRTDGPLSTSAKAKGQLVNPEVIAGVETREKENTNSPKLSPAAAPKRRWRLQPLSALNQRPAFQDSKLCTGEGETKTTNHMWRGPGGSRSVSLRHTPGQATNNRTGGN